MADFAFKRQDDTSITYGKSYISLMNERIIDSMQYCIRDYIEIPADGLPRDHQDRASHLPRSLKTHHTCLLLISPGQLRRCISILHDICLQRQQPHAP